MIWTEVQNTLAISLWSYFLPNLAKKDRDTDSFFHWTGGIKQVATQLIDH